MISPFPFVAEINSLFPKLFSLMKIIVHSRTVLALPSFDLLGLIFSTGGLCMYS